MQNIVAPMLGSNIRQNEPIYIVGTNYGAGGKLPLCWDLLNPLYMELNDQPYNTNIHIFTRKFELLFAEYPPRYGNIYKGIMTGKIIQGNIEPLVYNWSINKENPNFIDLDYEYFYSPDMFFDKCDVYRKNMEDLDNLVMGCNPTKIDSNEEHFWDRFNPTFSPTPDWNYWTKDAYRYTIAPTSPSDVPGYEKLNKKGVFYNSAGKKVFLYLRPKNYNGKNYD